MKTLSIVILLSLTAPTYAALGETSGQKHAEIQCALAIKERLSDPDGAEAVYSRALAEVTKKGYLAIVPIRGSNAFGGSVENTFICNIEGDKVVKIGRE